MSKFREFLEFNVAKPSFPSSTRFSGQYNFPDLRNTHIPGAHPVGGYSNFGQVAQTHISRSQYQNKDQWKYADILEKFANLAENVAAAINLRTHSRNVVGPEDEEKRYLQRRYTHAKQTSDGKILGLPHIEIVGGDYPRLHQAEMQVGQQLGILFVDNSLGIPDVWGLDTKVLFYKMQEFMEQMHSQTRGHERLAAGAEKIDQISDLMSQPSQHGVEKWYNP